MADKFYWLKLKRDFFKRHDIRVVEDMPNGKEYVLFYLKLLVESIDHEGCLMFSESIPYNENMLASVTNTNVDIVRAAVQVFNELDMLEILDSGAIYMTELNNLIGGETAWAEKKRKQRELPVLSNGSKRVNGEMILLPNGSTRFVDEKRYGGNGMLALDRSQGKCEICGKEVDLVIHHNNGYSNDINDLLCVCQKCHGEIHSKWGGQFPPVVFPMSDKSKSIEKDIELDKEIEKDIFKEKVKKEKRFDKPSIEEVDAYIKENHLNVDPMRFMDYYNSNGWKVGKNPMKDWKATCRNWSRKNSETYEKVGVSYDIETVKKKAQEPIVYKKRFKDTEPSYNSELYKQKAQEPIVYKRKEKYE